MSSLNEETSSSNKEEGDNICRDFIRGICDRKFCKYKHENDVHTSLNFCHDYQNNICPRPNCKFIHCTAEEVEIYKKTGEMSNQILAEATRKNQLPWLPPVCNQFRNGLCRRSNCKFRHVTKEQEEAEIREIVQNNIQRKQKEFTEVQKYIDPLFLGINRRLSYEEYNDSGPPFPKRKFSTLEEREMADRDNPDIQADRPVFKGYFSGSPPAILNRTLILEEENNVLHKEIVKLKKQVQDLTATNEFLLDQNANLRMANKQNSVNMPAVSISNTNSTHQVIRTVPASVATVPVSLATVSTCNPVSIAGCSSVSLASPAQILAPSQHVLVTTNPAQQLALATSTQQLTSQTQHMTSQHLALAASAPQQQLTLTSNPPTHQQLNQQLSSQAQQLASQQLTSQAQQLALANSTQQLTSQAQQLALANTTQQLATALATTPQQLTVTSVQPQQITLANTGQQLIAAQQNLAASTQQIELHRSNQLNTINTSQTLAISNTTQPMVSFPIMTQNITHSLPH